MNKKTNNKAEQIDNLPALLLDPIIEEELENPEGVFQLDDFTIKMKPREKGFLVMYDQGWQEVDTVPPLILVSCEVYWAQFDGTEYIKRDLTDPPPKKETDKWDKYGKLGVYHNEYGRGAFLLTPSGVLAFKGYFQKWKKDNVDVFNKPVRINSRVTKTGNGYIINVPSFLPGWIHEMAGLPAPTYPELADDDPPALEHSDYTVESDDDIPF